MSASPLVSVITPFLNVAPYLAECIDSVIAQTFAHWELILVDDGSSDGSSEIARRYAARFPDRIFYVDHPGHENRGISASRNLGFRHARGLWIASLDGDDVWLPTKLERQMKIASEHPTVGLLMGASRYWYSWTGDSEDRNRDEIICVGAPPETVVEPPRMLELIYPFGPGAAPSMNTVLIRADMVERIGGWEDRFQTAFEDQALLVKLYLHSATYVSSDCFDLYRQRPGSCMQTELTGKSYHDHRRRFLEWYKTYLGEQESTRFPAWSSLEKSLRQYRHPFRDKVSRLGRGVLARLSSVKSSR